MLSAYHVASFASGLCRCQGSEFFKAVWHCWLSSFDARMIMQGSWKNVPHSLSCHICIHHEWHHRFSYLLCVFFLIWRFKLFQTAQAISSNVVLFLPRNVDLDQLAELSWLASPPLPCEVTSLLKCSASEVLSIISIIWPWNRLPEL